MVTDDPVLARRERAGRLAALGQRIGYGLLGVAVVAFLAGFLSDFPEVLVTVVIVALAVGSVVLAPAIVLGYAVKAAAREDRERRR